MLNTILQKDKIIIVKNYQFFIEKNKVVIVGSFVAIGIAKLSFGGLGHNIFNPALVARVFLLVSFPVQMTMWPTAVDNNTSLVDAITGATITSKAYMIAVTNALSK